VANQEFTLEENKLIVRTSLDAGREDELRKNCDQLLARPEMELVIDLVAVDYIHSLSVAALSYAWVEAISRDKEVCFVVSQYVADVFERTGLSKVFTYKKAGGGRKG
jgi:anti-anti-sigma factor